MASYLILGAGKFGRLAHTRLARQDAAAGFTVVDRDPGALAVMVLWPLVVHPAFSSSRFARLFT